MTLMTVLQLVAALVVLSEALNKVERSDLFMGRRGFVERALGLAYLLAPWRWTRRSVATVFRVAGWSSASVGAAWSVTTPPDAQGMLVLCGFASLVVWDRMRECLN